MSYIIQVFTNIFSLIVTFPFLITLIIYMAVKFIKKNNVLALHKALDWSTLFYLVAVYFINSMYSDFPLISIITVLLLVVLSFILIYQRKSYNELNLLKASKIVWRLCFIIFFLLYIGYALYGIIRFILN